MKRWYETVRGYGKLLLGGSLFIGSAVGLSLLTNPPTRPLYMYTTSAKTSIDDSVQISIEAFKDSTKVSLQFSSKENLSYTYDLNTDEVRIHNAAYSPLAQEEYKSLASQAKEKALKSPFPFQ